MRVNNEAVCHEFAKGLNADISTHAGNLSIELSFYENEIYLYSYNTVIALYDTKKDIYIVNKKTYSNTTSKHQNYLRRALTGYKVIYVNDLNEKKEDILKNFFEDLKKYAQKQIKARVSNYTYQINDIIENLGLYLDYIILDKRSKQYKQYIKILNSEDKIYTILDLNKKDILSAEKAKKARLKKQKLQREKDIKDLLKVDFKAFLNDRQTSFEDDDNFSKFQRLYNHYKGEVHRLNLYDLNYISNYKDILKIKNDHIITSQRVTITKDDFIKFYKLNKRNLLKVGDNIIGYTVYEIKSDYIVIGCHTIAFNNIEYIYNKLVKGV